MTQVHYWSDGQSSQFKNQFDATDFMFHEQDYGGDVKNAVWRSVLQKKAVVSNLDEFVSDGKNCSELISPPCSCHPVK